MSSYWIAAEGKIRIPGSRVTGASVGPAGIHHAVGPDDHVLCGVRLSTLVPFRDMPWDGIARGTVRCSACVAATRTS